MSYNTKMAQATPHRIFPVETTAIDLDDETFAVSPVWYLSAALVDSVKRMGVLTPVELELADDRLRPVDGFARLRAALQTGVKTVPAVELVPSEPRRQFMRRLEARLATRPLDRLERALVLQKLKRRFHVPESILIRDILPRMGMRAERFHLRRHLELAAVAPRLQQALPTLAADIALQLNQWKDEEQNLFLELLHRYQLSSSRQKELFRWLDEMRQGQAGKPGGVLTVWEESGAAAADAEAALSPHERLRQIVARLRAARFPTLDAMERKARQLRAALRVPPQIQFQWPRFFEGDRIRVGFSFKTPEELRLLARRLGEIAEKDELERLIELL